MKKKIRLTAFILTAVLMSGSVGTKAVSFDSLDANTAVAGTSVAIRNFMESNENAAVLLAQALKPVIAVSEDPNTVAGSNKAVNSEEMLYDEAKIGVANVEGMLNVRSAPTTLSEIVEYAIRGADIRVIGECTVNGVLWYVVEYGAARGYVAGNYVLFGEEADAFREVVREEQRDPSAMPEHFDFEQDITGLDQSVQDEMNRLRNEINYCLVNEYPTQLEEEDYIGMYSILIYLLENYSALADIANENKLAKIFKNANEDIQSIELNRQKLSEETGQSEEDFIEGIVAENEEARQAEEAARNAEAERQRLAQEAAAAQQAAEAAQQLSPEEQQRLAEQAAAAAAAAEAQRLEQERLQAEAAARAQAALSDRIAAARQEGAGTRGRDIANYAESWIGRIHYGWGGDAFYDGGYVDCSHFTWHVLMDCGVPVGSYTTSYGQRSWGTPVDVSQIQPGDLVCYNGHVAIYFGNGLIVHAPREGMDISYGELNVLGIVGVRRFN